ncbi:MAG: hypothetical protein MJE68_05675 [Proteobacteria bacterium]|nr:hypothetical protein [Pseudomonadota bacterium]
MGVKDIEERSRSKIKKEADLYNDVIYFDDVQNSYFSLTTRTMRVFQYIVEQQYKFSYVLKCDDDTFPDVQKIATELQNRENPGRLYWGEFITAFIKTEGKWKETHWSVCQVYYPYAYGGGYILSGDLVHLIAENAPFLKKYNSEDVTVASWVSAYNIERKHDVRFTTEVNPRGCKDVYTMVHKVATEKITEHYLSLIHDGHICGPTNSWHGYDGYFYDWTAFPPSRKCCLYKSGIP